MTRAKEIRNDIDTLYANKKYYIGVLAELEDMGLTHTKDFKYIQKGVQTINNNIKRLEKELKDIEYSDWLNEEIGKIDATEILSFW